MQQLINLINERPLIQTHVAWFNDIANQLLLYTHIVANGTYYRIKEIEFYYHDELHEDTTVYGYMPLKFKKDNLRLHRHKQKQCETFTWFIHYSGIDIVFGKENTPGGILIRAIERINGDEAPELIKGPLVVMLELLNQSINVFDSKGFELLLVPANEAIPGEVKATKRVGLTEPESVVRHYNFFAI